MLIKTQDKTAIINMDCVSFIEAVEIYTEGTSAGIFAHSVFDTVYDEGILLGRYATMDEAKEVIGKIEHAYIAACNSPMVLRMPKCEEDEE